MIARKRIRWCCFILLLTLTTTLAPALALSNRFRSPSFRTRTTSLRMTSTTGDTANSVLVVGSANQDLTSYTAVIPQMGETLMGGKFETSCGGKGANQAIAAACLGISPVIMVSRVGQDSFGTDLLKNFRRFNVQYDESTTILKDPTVSTGVASIVVDTTSGDNMIIVNAGANFALTPDDVKTEISSMKNPPAVVVVQLEIKPETALEAIKAAKGVGAITVLNTAPAPEGWTLDDFFPFIDILIPNETELQSIADGKDDEETMAKSLLEKGVGKAVVVTLGARGAMIVAKEDDGETKVTMVDAPLELPCRKDPVVDTIGAGDAFCGALSTYLSAGLSMEEAAKKACGFASMSVRKQGAQSSYPTAEELPACLKL